MSRFLIVVGFVVSMISLLFLGAAVTELVTGTNLAATTPTDPGILMGISLFFTMATGGGVYLVWKNMKALKEKKNRAGKEIRIRRERQILKIIAMENGKITPLDIATRTEISIEDAKVLLDDLTNRLGGDVQITQDGGIVYVFDVTNRSEKDTAKRLTDT